MALLGPKKLRKTQRATSQSLVMEDCEPRILYSAELLPFQGEATWQVDGANASSAYSASDAQIFGEQQSHQQAQYRHELVIVDAATPDRDKLVADLLASLGAEDRDVEVLVLDADSNGIDQITDVLAQYRDLDAVHLISHGHDGEIQLGNSALNFETLTNKLADVQSWAQAFGEDADLMIYGCDLAATQDGQSLVTSLSKLTGADVAASTDATGDEALGGDWELEYKTGEIETALALSKSIQADFQAILATFTVTNTNDSGAGSLRDAITQANAASGADTIEFNISGTKLHTISLASALPTISDQLAIDGYTQNGSSANTLSEASDAVITIRIDGGNGLELVSGSDGSEIRGLMVTGSSARGIAISSSNNTVAGNWLGTDGYRALGNTSEGIVTISGSGNVIGGTNAADRNIVSGNGVNEIGIYGSSSGTLVQGNWVGPDATGRSSFGTNVSGIAVSTTGSGNIIGGTAAGAGNLISGHGQTGIYVNTDGNSILGNQIGTTASGDGLLGNGPGVFIDTAGENNIIGSEAAPNVIAGNRWGVVIDDTGSNGNTISANSIYDNDERGIDFGFNGVTANDNGDADTGPNGLLNFPVIYDAVVAAGDITITGEARPGAIVEFFVSDPDEHEGFVHGNGEGRTYIGSDTVSGVLAGSTDSTARQFSFTFSTAEATAGSLITATATDGSGNTSEFSQNALITGGSNLTLAPSLATAGSETRANSTTANSQYGPFTGGRNIGIDEDGNVTIAWESLGQDGDLSGIYVRRFDANSNPLTSEILVNETTSGDQNFPAVAVAPGGNFVVAWEDQSSTSGDIYFRVFDADGSALTSETRANTSTSGVQENVSIAMDQWGNFVIAWEDQVSGDTTIQHRRYNADGSAANGQTTSGSASGFDLTEPAITRAADGRYAIAWDDSGQDGSGAGVYARFYEANGSTSASTFRLSSTTAGDQYSPELAFLANGLVAAVWDSGSPDTITTRVFEFDGTAVTAEIPVNQATGGSRRLSGIAADAQGGYLLTWASDSQDGDGFGIFARRFSGGGVPLGNEFQVNSTSSGGQSYPSIASNASGRFAIAWEGNGSGDGLGIFFQQYAEDRFTSEAGDTAVVNVVLDSAPSANVTVSLASTDTGEATLSSSSLVFTSGNWDAPQQVTLTGVDDATVDGDVALQITATTSSTDSSFDGAVAIAAAMMNVDDEFSVTTAEDISDGDTSSISALVADQGADGAISLREAITAANNTVGTDTINFNIGEGGWQTISVTSSELPTITDSVIIDGQTQPGYFGAPLITLDGTVLGGTNDGLQLEASNSTIRGLIITNFTDEGIQLIGTGGIGDNNIIENNWVGVDRNGNAAGNGDIGIVMNSNSDDNIIRNNVVASNNSDAIVMQTSSTGNWVYGNIVGLAPDAITSRPNVGDGVRFSSAAFSNLVGSNNDGSNDDAEANIIANSGDDGVSIEGAAGSGNALQRNVIYGSTDQGIDIDNDNTVEVNDADDVDTGGNDEQNYPVLTSATVSGSDVVVDGVLDSTPDTDFRLEFFRVTASDEHSTDHGEASEYIGSVAVTTDSSGDASFSTTLPGVTLAATDFITSTATVDLGSNTYGSTSEFSSNIQSSINLSVTVNSTATTDENTALVFSGANVVQVSSGSAADTPLQVTLSVTNGVLDLSGTNGLTIVSGADGSGAMVIHGLESDLNTGLDGMQYTPTTSYSGPATLSVEVSIEADQEGLYTFESSDGTDTSAGTAQNGTFLDNATTLVDGTRGSRVLSLDGTDDGVQISGMFGNPADVTLAAWINPSSAGNNEIISLGDNIALRVNSGNLTAFYYDSGGWQIRNTSTAVDGGWHHVAGAFDSTGNVFRLYVDGVEVESFGSGNPIVYGIGTNTFIGQHGAGNGSFDYDGEIDDARIYTRALSAVEIAALAADTAPASDSVAITVNAAVQEPTDLAVIATTNGGLSINQDSGNDIYLQADDGGALLGSRTSLTYETRFSTTDSTSQTLVSYATATNDNEFKLVTQNNGDLLIQVGSQATTVSDFDFRTLADGQEHTVSFTWQSSGGAWSLYIDGIEEDSDTGLASGQTIDGGGVLVLGNEQDSPGGSFDPNPHQSATLFDVRLFGDIRTAVEVGASYRGALPFDEDNLLANWRFDDLSVDGVITDAVGGNNLNVNHATGGGFVASVAELTLSLDEIALDGTVVGQVAGTDAQREAQIASLLAADADLRYSAETGKFYKVVVGSFDLSVARTNAESTPLNTVNGQLVTIRSADENEFVRSLANSYTGGANVYLGGTDATVEGEWRWIEDGVEADQFWDGAEDGYRTGQYSNWFSSTQPNNVGGGEDAVRLDSTDGTWYDMPVSGSPISYVVEWKADEVLDVSQALNYTITSQPVTNAFEVDADTGEIRVLDGSVLDAGTQAIHTLNIEVTDVNNNVYDEDFTVTLSTLVDANNAPTDLSSGIELNVDGGNDAYLIADDGGDILGGLSAFTYETSFEISHVGRNILVSYAGTNDNDFLIDLAGDGSLGVLLNGAAISLSGIDYDELMDGERHSLAFSWDNTNGDWAIYVDGVLTDNGTGLQDGQTVAGSAGTGELVLGQEQDTVGGGFDASQIFSGTLYDVRIWNEVRSEAEISLNHRHKFDTGSLPSGLIANWQMDGFDGNGQVVDVVSGNNLSVAKVGDIRSWTNQVGGVTADGNTLTYVDDAQTTGWNSQINSSNMSSLGFTDDYTIRFTLDNTTNFAWTVGLGSTETNADFSDPEFAIFVDYLGGVNDVDIRHNGTTVGTYNINYAPGGEFGFYVNGTTLEYQYDGVTFATDTIPASTDWYIDTSFYMRTSDTYNNQDDYSLSNFHVVDGTGDAAVGSTASTTVEDLHISENALNGTTVSFVVPSDPDAPQDIASDGLFTESGNTTYTLFNTGQTFGGWTVDSGSVGLEAGSLANSPLGGYAIDMNGTEAGTISQTLSTTEGRQYQVLFAMSGNYFTSEPFQPLRASAGGESQDFIHEQPANWSSSNLLWGNRSFTFTADSASTELQFASLNNSGGAGALLGDVQVIEIPQAITTILNNDSTLSYDAATDKFYRFVDTPDNFDDVLAAATGSSLNGVDGQLVTIRSQYENDLVRQHVLDSGNQIWIGTYDTNNDGNWNWLDGDVESDEQFWTGGNAGAAEPGFYAPEFSQSEGVGEDYARILASGQWADTSETSNFSYIVEWDASEVLSSFTYSLTDSSGNFDIDTNTGEIAVAATNTLDYETDQSHAVDVTVTDAAGNSYAETMTITVDNGIESAQSVPGPQTVDEDTPLTFSGANAVTVTDTVGSTDSRLQVSLSVNDGILTLSQTTGLSILSGADGSGSMILHGTESDINAALDGMVFTPDAGFNGAVTLDMTTSLGAELVGQYTFESATVAGSVVGDVSAGLAQNGTLNGDAAISYDAERGDVLSLDGTGDFMQITGLMGNPANATLSAWINADGVDTNGAVVISMGESPVLYLQADGSLIGYYESGGTNNTVVSAESFVGTGWRHVAVSIDATNSTMSLYVDGVEIQTSVTVGAIEYDNSPDTYIGRSGTGGTGFDFSGQIDNARIYSRALSTEEILAVAAEESFGRIGPDLTQAFGKADGDVIAPDLLFIHDEFDAITSTGTISRLQLAPDGNSTPIDFDLLVLRPNAGDFDVIHRVSLTNSEILSTDAAGVRTLNIGSLDVQALDVIAHWSSNAAGSIPYSFGAGGSTGWSAYASSSLDTGSTVQESLNSSGPRLYGLNVHFQPFDSSDAVAITVSAVNDAPAFVQPELVTNGTFTGDISGWTTTGTAIYDGDALRFGGGNAVGPHTASQTIATEIGGTYELAFDYRDDQSARNQSLQVTVDGTSNLLTTPQIITDVTGTSFVRYTYSFTADSTSSTITFTDTSDTAGVSNTTTSVDGHIDNVSVRYTSGVMGSVTFVEGGAAVVLDADVEIFDADIDRGEDTFENTTLTLARNGGPIGEDEFSATGLLGTLTEGGNLVYNSVTVGTVTTNSGGTLLLTFNATADNTAVNNVMQTIAYGNSSASPPTSVQIDWTFNDDNVASAQGSGGDLEAVGSTTVNITTVNDAPVIDPTELLINGDLETSDLTGWTTTGTVSNPGNALRFGEFNAAGPHTASQSFTTIIGQRYTLEFSHRDDSSSLDQQMRVTVDGASNNLTRTVTSSPAGTGYLNYTYDFVADATTSILTFTDTSPSSASVDGFIDDVSVIQQPSFTAITEDDTNNAGNTVASILASVGGDLVTDVDVGAVEGIAVVDASWAFDYSIDGGTTWQRIDRVSTSNALLLRSTDLIRFVPNEIEAQIEEIEFRAWDQTSGTTGTYVSTAANGGSTAFSTEIEIASIQTTDVNDAPTFGSEGGFAVGYGNPGYNQNVASLALSDGSVLFSPYGDGFASVIGRLGPDGQLDVSFGTDGYFEVSSIGYIRDIKEQSDGKFVVVGENFPDIALARYNADGTLDTGFGTSGVVTTDVPGDGDAYEVAVHTDGSIVVVGEAGNDSFIAKYTSAGVLDVTFDGDSGTGNGIVTVNLGGTAERLGSVTILPDGRILAAGENHVIRLTTTGVLDTTFDVDGDSDGILAVGHKTNSVVVQANGDIAVTGLSGDNLVVSRFDADGSLDTGFGSGGTATWTDPFVLESYGVKIIQQTDGKLLVVGTVETNSAFGQEMAVVRFNTNGTLDTGFGSNGAWLSGLTNDYADGYDVSLYDDGSEEKIAVGGFQAQFGFARATVARLNADGTLDTTYQSGQLDGNPTYVEDGPAVVLDGNVQIFDRELSFADDFTGATLTLERNGGVDSDDVFSATGDLVLNAGTLELDSSNVGTYTNAGGQLILVFANSVTNEQVNEVMQSIAYSNSSDSPPATVQIDWSLDDGGDSVITQGGVALQATGNTTVNLIDVDEPAFLTVPIAQSVDEDTPLTFDSGTNAIVVESGSNNDPTVSVTLSVTNGTLTLPMTAGISFLNGTSNGDATLAISGTESAINTALDGMAYQGTQDYNGSDTLTVTTGSSPTVEANLYARYEFINGSTADATGNGYDGTITGDPTLSSDAERGDVMTFDGNDRIDVTNGVQSLGEEISISAWVNLDAGQSDNVFLSLNDEFFVTLDRSAAVVTMGVTASNFTTNSLNSADNIAGEGWNHVAATLNDTTKELSLYLNGELIADSTFSFADIDWATETDITIGSKTDGSNGFVGSLDDVRIYDAELTQAEVTAIMGDQGYDSETVAITVDPVNDTPAVTGPGSAYTVDEQTSLVIHGTGFSVTDADSASGGVTVTLAVGEGAITVAVGDSGAVISSGNGTDSVALTGTVAQIDNLLTGGGTGTISYLNNSDTPSATTTITVTVNDGGNTGADPGLTADGVSEADSASQTINVAAVNDTPNVMGPGSAYSVDEQTSLDIHGTGFSATDADSASGSVTATIAVGEGAVTVSAGDSGVSISSGNGTDSVVLTGTAAQVNNLLTGGGTGTISYLNSSNAPSASTTITVTVNDGGNTGTDPGLTADGSSEEDSAAQTINITAVNDTPDVVGPGSAYSVDEQASLTIQGTGFSVTDADSASGTVTATIAVGEGAVTVVVGDSGATISSGNGSGSVVLSGTVAQINNLLTGGGTGTVTYTNSSNTPSASTTITVTVNDQGNTGTDPGLT
ncbi:MAG: LamG-like jellyroll fold domain-containing protein, partial [Burkholderiaceae bacterium]